MAKLYVIRTGRTTWDQAQRVESAAGAPLSPEGVSEVRDAGKALAEHGIAVVYAGDGEAERQSAGLLAEALGAKVRLLSELRELDYGLWQGLTQAEIRARQPKVWRQWQESPSSVRPPGGETLEEAQARLRRTVRELARRHRDQAVLLVLRPVALGLVRCLLEARGVEALWQCADGAVGGLAYDMEDRKL